MALWRGGEVRRRFEGASPAPASMLAAHDLQLYVAGGRSSVVAVRALHVLSSCIPFSLRPSKTFPDVFLTWTGTSFVVACRDCCAFSRVCCDSMACLVCQRHQA